MKKLIPLLLLLAAVSARAERYPEGYGDDRAAIVDLQARYVMAMDYFCADVLDPDQQQRQARPGGMDAVRNTWYDEFVKIDGEWLFSLHRIHNEGNPRTFTAGQENPVEALDKD